MKRTFALILIGSYALIISAAYYNASMGRTRYMNALAERDTLLHTLQTQGTFEQHKEDYQTQLNILQEQLAKCQQQQLTQNPSFNITEGQHPLKFYDACTMAQKFIRQWIVKEYGFAEKHIKFPWTQTCDKTITDHQNGTYTFHGIINYKNALNADMTSTVTVVVQDKGEDLWGLESISF